MIRNCCIYKEAKGAILNAGVRATTASLSATVAELCCESQLTYESQVPRPRAGGATVNGGCNQ